MAQSDTTVGGGVKGAKLLRPVTAPWGVTDCYNLMPSRHWPEIPAFYFKAAAVAMTARHRPGSNL